jgi:hydrophobic/amphiphilic exporter-1 (mainly G- bacteria), HAE1 family
MIRAAVRRPVATIMVFLGLVLIGVVSIRRIPVDLLPEINYPKLTVVTQYPEVQAEDVERLVTVPLEAAVTSLPRVRHVESRSREGLSTITVEYEWGTDMDFAGLHLREALDRVAYRNDWPGEAERPLILRWDPSARPISILVLQGERPLREITEFATEVAKPALEQIQGVSQAEVVGGAEREIRVEPDPEKLRIYNVSVDELASALRSANVSFPGGRVRQGPLHLSLRILGEFEDVSQIAETALARPGGETVRIGDVAQVLDDVKEPEGATLLRGREVVSILLYKEIGANSIAVAGEVDRVLGMLHAQYPTFSYDFIYRDADFIRASYSGLIQSLIYGALLAFAMLFLFLHDARSPLVVGVSMPVSILITFGFLYLSKVKLNLMSLGGLSLAAGMLMDNAIVVLESVTRRIQEIGGRLADCVVLGTSEIAVAVLASTLTTVAVFFPVVYVPGVAGAFFRDQALTVTFSLLVSVATALLLQSTLSVRLLSTGPLAPRGPFKLFTRGVEATYDRYHGLLAHALDHKVAWSIGLVALLGGSTLLALALPRGLLPARSTGDYTLALELPPGTPLAETEAQASRVAAAIETQPEVKTVFVQVGTTERTLAAVKEYTASHTARLRIILKPGQARRRVVEALKENAGAVLAGAPSVTYAFREEGIGLREVLGAGGAPFTLGVLAERPEDAVRAAVQVRGALPRVAGLSGLEMDRVLGTPNVVLRVDREEAIRSGLDPEFLARELRNRILGVAATTYNQTEERVDIAVRLPEAQRHDLAGVLATPVEVAPGRQVGLARFVHQTEETPVRELVRRDQRRMVTITGDVRGRRPDRVRAEAAGLLSGLALPPDVRFVWGGEQEETAASFRELGFALLLSVVIVYLILAGMYESFLDPLLIAAVIPMGFAGAAITLWLTGQSINILSLIGLIALVGIGVNDAIVKVDAIRRLRGEGLEMRAAILEAGRLRYRPIVMNTMTAVIGMVPMAIGVGAGENLQRPLALTLGGGLLLATFLTLIYTPLMYEWVHGLRRRPAAPRP